MTDTSDWPNPKTLQASGADDRERRHRLFSAYVDGALPEPVADTLEERLGKDPAFRGSFDSYAAMVDAVRRLPRSGGDEAFVSDVQDTLRRRSGGRFFGATDAHLSTLQAQTRLHECAAAAMLALMLGAYLSFGPSNGDLSTEDSPRLDVPAQSAERHQ